MDVATPEAWRKDPALVTRFYNARRTQLLTVKPNAAHLALARLQEVFSTKVITQNVDDLHERAGTENLLHLHGELTKVRSERFPSLVYDIGYKDVELGDTCEKGFQLRPHIVWFGEDVPLITEAAEWVKAADILIVIGTSLNVYPAAGLLYHAPYATEKYLVDPNEFDASSVFKLRHIQKTAGEGVPELVEELIARYATKD